MTLTVTGVQQQALVGIADNGASTTRAQVWCWRAADAQRVVAELARLRASQQQPHLEVELLANERTPFVPAQGGAPPHHATVELVAVTPLTDAATYFDVDDAVRAFAAGQLAQGSVLHTELPMSWAVVAQRASGFQPTPPAGGGALGATATNLVVNVLPMGPQWVPGPAIPEFRVYATASQVRGRQTLRTAAVSWVWETTAGHNAAWFWRLRMALPTSTVDFA